jgi:hypothetical protein
MSGHSFLSMAAAALLLLVATSLNSQSYTAIHTEDLTSDRFQAFLTCSVEGKDLDELITKLVEKDRECREGLQGHATLLWARPFIREARQALSHLRVLDNNWTMTSSLGNPNSTAVGTYTLGMVYCVEGDLVANLAQRVFPEELAAAMEKLGLSFGQGTGEPLDSRGRGRSSFEKIPTGAALIGAAKRGTNEALKQLSKLTALGGRPEELPFALTLTLTQETESVRVVATLRDPLEDEPSSTLQLNTTLREAVTPTRTLLFGEVYSMAVGSGAQIDAEAVASKQEKLGQLLGDRGLRCTPAGAPYLLSTTGKIEESALVFDVRKELELSTLWLQQLMVPMSIDGTRDLHVQLEELRMISSAFRDVGGSLHAGSASIVSYFEARMAGIHRPQQFSALNYERTDEDIQQAHLKGVGRALRFHRSLAPFAASLLPATLGELQSIRTSDFFPDPHNNGNRMNVTVAESWTLAR